MNRYTLGVRRRNDVDDSSDLMSVTQNATAKQQHVGLGVANRTSVQLTASKHEGARLPIHREVLELHRTFSFDGQTHGVQNRSVIREPVAWRPGNINVVAVVIPLVSIINIMIIVVVVSWCLLGVGLFFRRIRLFTASPRVGSNARRLGEVAAVATHCSSAVRVAVAETKHSPQ